MSRDKFRECVQVLCALPESVWMESPGFLHCKRYDIGFRSGQSDILIRSLRAFSPQSTR